VHWTTVYRLRRGFLADPVATAVARQPSGPDPGGRQLDAKVEEVINAALSRWLPRQRFLARTAMPN
jgi:putative transposase